jgi:NADH-quinone oxidoreductase subunit C
MKTPEEVYNILKAKFNGAIVDFKTDQPFEQLIIVDPKEINKVGQFLKDDEELFFNSLMNLSGVDEANGEKVQDADGSTVIKGGTLSVYYHLYSIKHNHKVTLKVYTERENPEIETVSFVWRTADWHEREAYDMLGIKFLHHPDLRRILLPDDWEGGAPLRKDFKVPEFYNGMKIPY